MSVTWKLYAEYIIAKGNVDQCMIIDAEDGAHWASIPEDFMVRFLLLYIPRTDVQI